MSAQNRYFSPAELALLAAPESWRYVGPGFEPEVSPVKDPAYRRWAARHHDRHGHTEILFPLGGETRTTAGGKTLPCAPGSVFYFPAFEPHDKGYPKTAGPFHHLWISLLHQRVMLGSHLFRTGREREAREFTIILDESETGLDLVRFLSDLGPSGNLPSRWQRHRLAAAVQAIIAKAVEKGFAPESTDASDFQRDVVEAMADHIRATAGNGVSLENLARTAGYSKYHFLRIFRKHTGRTVQQEIDLRRRERVQSLQAKGMQLKDIGAALGFSCPASFSRWYRRHC
jgi:AraC-like DNA-binding protein